MNVRCPSCDTCFAVPEEKYSPGRKARCSQCRHIFLLPEIEPKLSESSFSNENADEFFDESFASSGAGAVPAESERQIENVSATHLERQESPETPGRDEAGNDISDPLADMDVVLDEGKEQRSASQAKKGKKLLLLLLVTALLVLSLLFAGYLLFGRSSAPQLAGGEGPSSARSEELRQREAERFAKTRLLSVGNLKQYVVSGNTKTGRMYVFEGTVHNGFDTAKSLILVEVSLFDKEGRFLGGREQYCGPVLTQVQLQSFSKSSIEQTLNNREAIFAVNSRILPGESVSFITVLFDVPQDAEEYEVKIVDVQDAP